ncbi:hypothetical protein SAMN05216217_11390 [Halopseudomonas yangmingensis]|uniref:Uncharacterized protein n=1 Tax=Halopseudomonas yangmingensis TaxID=1720063 RepID=A0A1I4TAT2_9GAMM|nr:hypothetical protein SAMN05216217_11390 [Halopseudomonas yangmingensis]
MARFKPYVSRQHSLLVINYCQWLWMCPGNGFFYSLVRADRSDRRWRICKRTSRRIDI